MKSPAHGNSGRSTLSAAPSPSSASNLTPPMPRLRSPQDDARAFNHLVSAAVDITDAHVRNGVLSVVRSVRDIDVGKRRRLLYSIPIPNQGKFKPFSIPPVELAENVKARIPSMSGDKLLILKEEALGNDEKRQVMEVWTNGADVLSNKIVVPKKLHGKIINDPGGFGSLSWNEDETAVVYAAERLHPKTASFFDPDESETEKSLGGEYVLGVGQTETWGEKYTKQSPLLDLFIVHLETGKIAKVENVPTSQDRATTDGGFVLGQGIFSPCGTHIVYTAWDAGGGDSMPKRLGMIYCYNRASKIYASPVQALLGRLGNSMDTDEDGPYNCLSPSTKYSRSPRFSPPKGRLSKLCYLASTGGFDTHNAGAEVHTIDWDVKTGTDLGDTTRILVETVEVPRSVGDEKNIQVANMSFPGLYMGQLPHSCCTEDYLLTTTQWGSVQSLVRISFEDGSVSLVNADVVGQGIGLSASQRLLCVDADGGAIVSVSAPNLPAIVAYIAPDALKKGTVSEKAEATLVTSMGPAAASSCSSIVQQDLNNLLDFMFEVLTVPSEEGNHDLADCPAQAIFLRPISQRDWPPPPVIVIPHGGPHSCTSTAYNPAIAFLCSTGYAILLVNYRGSIGFGEKSIKSLPGSIGVLDVKDVVGATTLISDSGWVDKKRIGICGGSHGGFLTAHCIGQFPELFKVAALRNPVTNIAAMVTSTDIPDWCYTEGIGIGTYNFKDFHSPNREELGRMFDCSPVKHVSNVVAPTLVALGLSDKRVPPSQGLEFFHTLRAKGVSTKLLQYPDDDHAIDKVRSEADHWINIKRWFDTHL